MNFPMMCADGYQPRVIDTEPPVLYTTPPWMSWKDRADVLSRYYTCCPPDLSADTTAVTRDCSDPTTMDDNANISLVCNDIDTRQYPRPMKTNHHIQPTLNHMITETSYMCCDSIIPDDENKTTNFLDETECVPYHDDVSYGNQLGQNHGGRIAPRFCNFQDDDFRFPRPLATNDSLSINYKCCKTGPALPPFVQDSAFKLTVYPQIVVSSIAAISCIVLILGLLIPFFMQLKDGTHQRAQLTGRRTREGKCWGGIVKSSTRGNVDFVLIL